jgi:hypothetical protein
VVGCRGEEVSGGDGDEEGSETGRERSEGKRILQAPGCGPEQDITIEATENSTDGIFPGTPQVSSRARLSNRPATAESDGTGEEMIEGGVEEKRRGRPKDVCKLETRTEDGSEKIIEFRSRGTSWTAWEQYRDAGGGEVRSACARSPFLLGHFGRDVLIFWVEAILE